LDAYLFFSRPLHLFYAIECDTYDSEPAAPGGNGFLLYEIVGNRDPCLFQQCFANAILAALVAKMRAVARGAVSYKKYRSAQNHDLHGLWASAKRLGESRFSFRNRLDGHGHYDRDC
jgi:hypothetical protein